MWYTESEINWKEMAATPLLDRLLRAIGMSASSSSLPIRGTALAAERPPFDTRAATPLCVVMYRRRAGRDANASAPLDERAARAIAAAAASADVYARDATGDTEAFDRCGVLWVPHTQLFCAEVSVGCTPRQCARFAAETHALHRAAARDLALGRVPPTQFATSTSTSTSTTSSVTQAPDLLPPVSELPRVFDAVAAAHNESWRASLFGSLCPPHALPVDPAQCLVFEGVLTRDGRMAVRCVTLEQVCARFSSRRSRCV